MTRYIFANYNYYHNSFSRFLLYENNIVNCFNAGLIFTAEVFILYKKVWELRGKCRYTFDFGIWDFLMSFAFINRSHDKIL